MKTLNQQAKSVFLTLIKDLEDPSVSDNSHRIVDNSNGTFMPVHIERIGECDYSIAHYGKQNGDLMRDPEMVFAVEEGQVFPTYWRNDYLGAERFSAIRKNGAWQVKPDMQADQAVFAHTWLENIKHQQGL